MNLLERYKAKRSAEQRISSATSKRKTVSRTNKETFLTARNVFTPSIDYHTSKIDPELVPYLSMSSRTEKRTPVNCEHKIRIMTTRLRNGPIIFRKDEGCRTLITILKKCNAKVVQTVPDEQLEELYIAKRKVILKCKI